MVKKHTQHGIYHLNPFGVLRVHLVIQMISRPFHLARRKLYPLNNNLAPPHPPPPRSSLTTAALPRSVFLNLTTPGASCKWGRAVFVLPRLAYFTWRNACKLRPCGSVAEQCPTVWTDRMFSSLYGHSTACNFRLI